MFIALGVEWISRLRAEVVRLQSIERERDVEREQSERMRRLLEWQAQVAKHEAALNAIHMKIYSDAFLEVGGVQRIPFEALSPLGMGLDPIETRRDNGRRAALKRERLSLPVGERLLDSAGERPQIPTEVCEVGHLHLCGILVG